MDHPVAVAREKFNDLQKYVPFLEKFTSCINNNEQSGDETFVEKRNKCLTLLNMLKNDFSEKLKLPLLVNIEKTVKKLMEQSGDRLIQSKSYKKEPSEHGNQSPEGSTIQSNFRQNISETVSTSKDRKEIRNSYNEVNHRSHYDSRKSEYHSRSPDSYRRRSPENHRARRSGSRSSERYKSDHGHQTDLKRDDNGRRSRSRDRNSRREHRRFDEGYMRERSYDYSRDRERFESNESCSHRSRHESSYTRDNRDKCRYTNSLLPSVYDRSRSKTHSVFDRLEPRTNSSNKLPVKRQEVPNGRSRFEPNADWDDGSPPRKKIGETISELEILTQNRFGRSKEDDKLSEIMKRQNKAEQLRAELKKQEQMEIANKLLNEIQSSGEYVRKDSVKSSLDKGETRNSNESSERIDRNESFSNSKNNIPTQRTAIVSQERSEPTMNKSLSRAQYINPWLNQQPDPRQQSDNESSLHVTIPPRVFGEHVTSHGNPTTPTDQSLRATHAFGSSSNMLPINPLNNNNGNLPNNAIPIVRQPIHNEQYPVNRETVPIIAPPQVNHPSFIQNSNVNLKNSHQHVSNQMQSNQRPFNKNQTHNSPEQVGRKANMSYGQYKRARESLEKTNRSNILVTISTASNDSSLEKEQTRNESNPKTVTLVDSTKDSNKTSEKDATTKNVSGTNDKRSEDVSANSHSNASSQNKSITKYRIPKLNRSDSSTNSKQQNQLQEPSKVKEKSRTHSNQKHAEKAKDRTPIRNKTKDKDRRRSENSQIFADTTTGAEQMQDTSSSRNDSSFIDSSTPAVEQDDNNDDVVSSSTSRRESTGSNALNSSHSDSNERPNKEKRKAAKTKKNELDRLNEDIMANCNDVVMATGKRACTITSRKGQIEDSITRATPNLYESNSGESSDEIGKPKAKRTKVIKSKLLIDDSSDDSETEDDEILLRRTRPGPKSTYSAKKPLRECLVVLERLDEATVNQYTKPYEDKKVSCIKNTNPKMTTKDSKECVICKRSYRSLVRHYNSVHEGVEVYCSRMSVENSNKIRNGRNIQKIIYDKGKPTVRCLFCDKNVRKDSIGRVIDHFTSHTGEFIKKCTKCGVTVNSNTTKSTNCAHSKHRQENMVQFSDNIYVFMCNICNYAQSQEENLKKHIEEMHEIKLNIFEQYKRIILVTNVGGRRRTNNKESVSNDGESSNQEAYEPTKQDEDSNEENTIRTINENSFKESSSNVQTARKRTIADELHERLGGGGQSSGMKSESGEDAINVVLRGADEVSDNDTEKTNVTSDRGYLTGEAIENMYKIEIAKEEMQASPIVKNGNNGNYDEADWESCSTGSDDDDQSDGKFNNKMSTRLTSVSGKSKISKTKFKSKKRNEKSIFGTMSYKFEPPEIVNLVNEDDDINLGASTSQQSLVTESLLKDDGKRIDNFAYTEADNQIKYTCYIGNCNFISLNNSSSFSNHLRKQHNEAWKGYCHSCDKQILNGSFSLMKEFNHMMEIHLPDVNRPYKPIRVPTSDLMLESNPEPVSAIEDEIPKLPEPEKPAFRLKVRRLSGDLLSGPTASDTGIIISNVTSLSELENDINDPQLSGEPIEDNLMKPWTKCPNTKPAVACTKLSRQISLVALFKCMAIDCIFTTSDRDAMLTHLNNHEDFLMQPTNSSPSYTDSDSWLECCYCEQILDSCTVLVDHIEQQHSDSIFQCAYCFYRSVDPCNVDSHINFYHKDKCRMVLICGTHPKCLSEEIDILTSKTKDLKRVPCTFPGCNDSFLRLNDLNNHLDQSHVGKTYFRCPFCPMRLSKLETGGIDLTHFQYHNIALYHCAHCPEFETFDSDSMQKHLRDEHSSHLAYAVARFDNGILNTELDASIARAYRAEKYYALCHSSFTPNQINFMNPSLSEYVANSGEVPNTYQDSSKAKENEITFKDNLQLERKTRVHLHKKYNIYTFDQINTGSWKTSPAQIKDNLSEQLSQNEEAVTFSETTGQMDYITSIQNEIDASAKALLSETGVPHEKIYQCGLTDCQWLGSSIEGSAFLDHLSQHHLFHSSHKCYHCNVEFSKPVELKNHIDVAHTTDRYFCFLCNNTEASEQFMIAHFKSIHKNNFMHFIPLNPCQIDRTKDIFVGCPSNVSFINDFGMKLIERKENKMLAKEYYSPQEVNMLPNRHVFTNYVYCKRCNYKTKVRLNMERHLLLCKVSNSIETNLEHSPVNPAPYLDTGEMYSDKMKNLAASSNVAGDSAIQKDPSLRYVPDTERYMCGAVGCSYQTISSEHLQEHLECSHKDQATYYCPHCRTEIVGGLSRSIEIINHLRLHSKLIFKCSVCLYGHYEKNDVEIHIADVHPKATVQKLVRPQKQIEFVKPAAKTIISKWKCNICTNKFNSKTLVKQHLSTHHQIKYNYQCGLCAFQDDAKVRIKEHLLAIHSQNDATQLKMFFEQVGIDNDNSPLWKRDDPTRNKHIRGILLEEEEKTNHEIPNVKATATTSSNRKQTWTCDIPSFASKTNTEDRFVIVPSKNIVNECAFESVRPTPTRQMPKRRASMFVSSPSEFMSSSLSNSQPPIPKIRFKRVNIDENLMPPPAKVLKVYGPRNNISDTNRSSLIYHCDYCAISGSHYDGIRLHWKQIHQRDNSDDPEAKQFRYRVSVQVLCVHCNEIMTFASIWEHLARMHSNAKFAFAKFDPDPSADIHCGMCSKRVSTKIDLEVHFNNEHASSINSKAKVQPMPFFNDTIVETLIDQGNHETVKCLYCQERFICRFDYEQHHQQYHPENIESHENTDSNIIKYGCMECQVYSTNRNNIISHMWKNHIQSRYQCLYCPKETQYKKLIRTHHELTHKSNEVRYRVVDASENIASFYRMSMNFSNGLVLFWGDMLQTKFSQIKQLIDHVNELNRADLENYVQSTEPSVNDVSTPGRIGSRRRQTHQL